MVIVDFIAELSHGQGSLLPVLGLSITILQFAVVTNFHLAVFKRNLSFHHFRIICLLYLPFPTSILVLYHIIFSNLMNYGLAENS